MAQVTVTVGPSGTGKTYTRAVAYLVEDYLVNQLGKHYSNFPVKVDEMGKWFSAQDQSAWPRQITADEVGERVQRIPPEVLATWTSDTSKAAESGPWEYFAELDIRGAWIAIDEAHRYCGSSCNRQTIAKWADWIGHLRHEGAACEFLTQSPGKLAKKVRDEAEVEIVLVPPDQQIGLWGINYADWSLIESKWWGREVAWFIETRHVMSGKSGGGSSGRIAQPPIEHCRRPSFYALYDSYNKIADEGEIRGEKIVKDELWRRYSWLNLAWYIWRKYHQQWLRVWWSRGMGLGAAIVVPCVALWFVYSTLQDASKPKPAKSGAATAQDTAKERAVPSIESFSREQLLELYAAQREILNQALKDAHAMRAKHQEMFNELGPLFAEFEGAGVLSLVSEDHIVFRSGRKVPLNSLIRGGAYNGRKVIAVDLVQRGALLDSGEWLGAGQPSERLRDFWRKWSKPDVLGGPVASGAIRSLPAVPAGSSGGDDEPQPTLADPPAESRRGNDSQSIRGLGGPRVRPVNRDSGGPLLPVPDVAPGR